MNGARVRRDEWRARIQDDERAATILIEEGGPPSTIGFLAQQIAEKSLKMVLTYHEQDVPKIHGLLDLAQELKSLEPDVVQLTEALKILEPYYIPTRYPADYPELSHTQAVEAFEAAQRVYTFARRATGLDAKGKNSG